MKIEVFEWILIKEKEMSKQGRVGVNSKHSDDASEDRECKKGEPRRIWPELEPRSELLQGACL